MTTIIDVSKEWNNGIERTLTKSGQYDPYDKKSEFRIGDSNIGGTAYFDGKGNCTIKGHMSRLYCHYPNYNSKLTLDFVPNFITNGNPPDDISMKLRSRHHISTDKPCAERVGGVGWNVRQLKWIQTKEKCHNLYKNGHLVPLSKPMVNGQKYTVSLKCEDQTDGKIRLKGTIDQQEEMNVAVKVESFFFDKSKILSDSIFWIRFNGTGSITFSNVKLELFA